MVLFNPQGRIDFPQYGISIPALPTRAIRTMEHLMSQPDVAARSDQWRLEEIPEAVTPKDLLLAHNKDYVEALYDERLEEKLLTAYELIDGDGNYHRYDPKAASKPLTAILDDILRVISGTYLTVRTALERGFCYYLGGGMHHAHPDFGHGFCLVNDISVALLKARQEGLITSAWIVDVDAHRGDGTAEIMAEKPDMTTISIHMASGWPLDSPRLKEDGSLNPSWFPGDVDIPIEAGEENQYIGRLIEALENLEADNGLPDLFFVVGGVDPYEKDELPSTDLLNLTREQMADRDMALYRFFSSRNRPQAWVAAGGYGGHSWEVHGDFLSWVLSQNECTQF